LPDDELPEWKRARKPAPQIDLNKLRAGGDIDSVLKSNKKGQSLMTFVEVSGAAPTCVSITHNCRLAK
jgi:hypothetical protein